MSSKTEDKEQALAKNAIVTDYNSVQCQKLVCKISFQLA